MLKFGPAVRRLLLLVAARLLTLVLLGLGMLVLSAAAWARLAEARVVGVLGLEESASSQAKVSRRKNSVTLAAMMRALSP
jgi:hypothetical protein